MNDVFFVLYSLSLYLIFNGLRGGGGADYGDYVSPTFTDMNIYLKWIDILEVESWGLCYVVTYIHT